MSATASQTKSQTKSLHLLRALLREASYLPDASARDYFRRYIVARFKAYQPTHNATASFDVQAVDKHRHRSFKRRHVAVINERTGQQQRKAWKGLNFLRRANQGEGPCLEKVLWFTYGRLGRRKYTLLADLLKPDPAWPDAPAPLQQLYHSNLSCLQYFEAPQARNGTNVIRISKQFPRLRAVITTQVQKQISLSTRKIRRAEIKTPVLNTWERPMPIKRAVNNVRRWYAENMERLLPALAAAEWDGIEAMSKGRQHISFAKQRTPVLSEADVDNNTLEQTLHHHLALDKLSKADRPQGIDRPHTLTARYMQRLYARLLTVSCKLEYDPTRKQWDAIWGQLRKDIRPNISSAPVADVLFADVDTKGNAPKAPSTKSEFKVPLRYDAGDSKRFPFFAEWLPATHPMRVELDLAKKERDAAQAKWLASGGESGGEAP